LLPLSSTLAMAAGNDFQRFMVQTTLVGCRMDVMRSVPLTGGKTRRPWVWVAVVALALPSPAQNKTLSMLSTGPAQILPQILILPEQVVDEEWPVMLATVHAPKELTAVEPGQCIRFGVGASGDGRDLLLKQAKFAFEFSFGGNSQTFSPDSAQSIKLTTPNMFEFLEETLSKNRIPKEVPKDGALAASARVARWCAPADVRDGTATVRGKATLPDGKTVELKRRKIEIRSFETARKKTPWKGLDDIENWVVHYHEAPDPAQLLPALRVVANEKHSQEIGGSEAICGRASFCSTAAFFGAALKAHPGAAEDLRQRLSTEDRWTRLIGTIALAWAGYPTGVLHDSFDAGDKALLDSVHLPDAFDMTPNIEIGARQDMLWATFFATGRIEPVRAIASALEWSEDYNKLMERARQAHASGDTPSMDTPEYAFRGVAYGAAGWSMSSLAARDALLYDYTEALKASPDTPPAVKKELTGLFTNPAFKYPAGQDQK